MFQKLPTLLIPLLLMLGAPCPTIAAGSLVITKDPHAFPSLVREFDYELKWTADKQYRSGTQIDLAADSIRNSLIWSFLGADAIPGEVVYRSDVHLDPSHKNIISLKFPRGIRPGEEVTFRLRLKPSENAPMRMVLSIWTTDVALKSRPADPPPERVLEGSSCAIEVAPGPVERFSVYSRPFPSKNGKVRVSLVPEDRFGNPTQFTNPVPVAITWNGEVSQENITGSKILYVEAPEDVGRMVVGIPMSALGISENVSNGVREGNSLVITGNPVWKEGPNGLIPSFGEFHWHTEASSDGMRTIDEALTSARDSLNMDFVAPGDHSPEKKDWEPLVKALDQFNVPGEFTTFFGWEQSTVIGHQNYYFTEADHPVRIDGDALKNIQPGATLSEIVEELSEQKRFFAVPHHTNVECEMKDPKDGQPWWHAYEWIQPPPDYIRLVEIMQMRGNQERNEYTDVWRGWHTNGSSVQDALKAGYKVGFTGGTDNHEGFPGKAFGAGLGPDVNTTKSVILTGAWVRSLDRQAVWDALYDRHTWAVWNTRALVWFTVNSGMSGDEVDVKEGEEVTAFVKMSCDDALQSLEIISEGKTVWSKSFDMLDFEVHIPLPAAEKSTHYYLRALQRDGGIIYASPVFLHVAS